MTTDQHRAITTADDPRWVSIRTRDAGADGRLWYSVSTTGIYCRPSCPSRRPAPAHVTLHDSLDAARATGCRPCRRCDPDGASPQMRTAALIERACRLIETAEGPTSTRRLAASVGLSAAHFHRSFKRQTGVTPKAYALALRARHVQTALTQGESVTDAIYASGYNSNGRFYAQSTAMLGMTPTRYRRGGVAETLRFAVGQSSLGAVLVASSEKGIVAILLGDDPDALVRELQDRFAQARLIGADRAYERTVAQVVGLLDAPAPGLNLPLDIRGTVFQQRVWTALRAIPSGRTVTYSEIAQRIGAPAAVRAVAGACAANTLAVAIPCHRVIRTDATLSGYRWGIERKRSLLAREARPDQSPGGSVNA